MSCPQFQWNSGRVPGQASSCAFTSKKPGMRWRICSRRFQRKSLTWKSPWMSIASIIWRCAMAAVLGIHMDPAQVLRFKDRINSPIVLLNRWEGSRPHTYNVLQYWILLMHTLLSMQIFLSHFQLFRTGARPLLRSSLPFRSCRSWSSAFRATPTTATPTSNPRDMDFSALPRSAEA